MVPCKACPIFHDPRTNCRVAANQLKVGTLPEPWLSANRLTEIVERKAAAGAEKLPEGIGLAESRSAEPVPAAAPKRVPSKIPVDRGSGSKRWDRMAYNAYMRAYMKKYRARLKQEAP